jgi:hypothetical protein
MHFLFPITLLIYVAPLPLFDMIAIFIFGEDYTLYSYSFLHYFLIHPLITEVSVVVSHKEKSLG